MGNSGDLGNNRLYLHSRVEADNESSMTEQFCWDGGWVSRRPTYRTIYSDDTAMEILSSGQVWIPKNWVYPNAGISLIQIQGQGEVRDQKGMTRTRAEWHICQMVQRIQNRNSKRGGR